jgi:TetR/AcrR family transcriptional regulator, cholesterol catabolism regulator
MAENESSTGRRPAAKGKVGRRRQKAEENWSTKREFILDTAAGLFAQYGYQATTLDALAEHTRLNKGTLYYYYDSKVEILFDLCISTAAAHIEALKATYDIEDPAEALDYAIERTTEWVREHRNRVRVYFQEEYFFPEVFNKTQLRKIREQQRAFMRVLYGLLERGITTERFRPMDVSLVGRLIAGVILWPYRWPDQPKKASNLIKEIRNLLHYGVDVNPAESPPAVGE